MSREDAEAPTLPRPPGSVDFVNRSAEADTTATAVCAMVERLRGGRQTAGFENVLVFHGGTGVGKSSLSHRLQSWLRGDVDAREEWGAPPCPGEIATVRWDMAASQGELDTLSVLLSFRRCLPDIPGGWKLFDTALLSYFTATRPGEDLQKRAGMNHDMNHVHALIAGLATDTSYFLDGTGGVLSFAIRGLIEKSLKMHEKRRLKGHAKLRALAEWCRREDHSNNPSPELAAAVLDIADTQLREIEDPCKRPLIVVFIDHFEKLQSNDERNGEAAMNHLVTALPECLFVITGQRRIDWDDPGRTSLRYAGPGHWPGLREDAAPPGQHPIGMLSSADSARLLRLCARREGFALPRDDVELQRLVEGSHGWPIYIATLCRLTANLAQGAPGTPISAEHLGVPMDDLVRRLLHHLKPQQADVFRSACLVPFFDVPLVAAMAGSSQGEVLRTLRRAMVETTEKPEWPYRVHEVVRNVIAGASPGVAGGWTEADRKRAVGHGIGHLEERCREASEQDRFTEAVSLAGLAVRLAAEQGVWSEWFSPRHDSEPDEQHDSLLGLVPPEALAPLVPLDSSHPEIRALLHYIHAQRKTDAQERLADLERIAGSESEFSRTATLMSGYLHRLFGRTEETVKTFQGLVEAHPDWQVPISQIGITLNQARRFQDALKFAETAPSPCRRYIHSNQRRFLGDLTHSEVLPPDRRVVTSTRHAIELLAYSMRRALRTGVLNAAEFERAKERAAHAAHHGAQRTCLFVDACLALADREAFQAVMDALLQFSIDGLPSSSAVEAQALRALLTRDPADAQRAWELLGDRPYRSAGWIPAESYLEALGYRPEPMPAQWPEPEEVVRGRWLEIGRRIIATAQGADT